ncbi:synaptic vesicle membrane protein VAT-1 homolog-like isoform X2 [Osmia lignaria lignaria]|uniref:synaptic vesicle membrane protein VAT-1 homolog-like isoform X2 n=1 Tax=Osmia lignaria lignaria TaxID=1437193 RepID=UPI0014796A70|nr:synaptic vesicle membrane protein VAT-1 homolog-like isoform X2 [Osmia lignaria]
MSSPTIDRDRHRPRCSSGLNFQDLMARQGAIDSPPKTPFIMGSECAGDIEQVGEGVENFKVGDRVVALPDHKAWAELVAVPATSVFALPDGMSYLDAAAITMNYTVAYMLLFELANLTPGKSLLLHSAGGGVGQAVVQLAKTVKDVTIFGVCSKSKHEALKAAGTIDHLLERSTDYTNEVRKISPEGVDIVLDCLCGEECNKGYALLKPMGKYILYGSSNVVTGETKSFFSAARSWWQVDKVSPIKLFDENKTLSGFKLRHLMYQQGSHGFVRKAVERVFALWNEGKIKPVVDSTWALEDVPEAMQKMHDRKNIGKIVLDPSLEPKPKPATPAKGKAKDKKAASQESQEKKASSVESEEGEKKKEPELTNGTSEDKSDSDSKEKESS